MSRDVSIVEPRHPGVRSFHLARWGIGIALAVLVLSYLWLAADHRTLWLWNTVVHESGRYTLGQTVFYFSHFLREIPVAIAYTLFLLSMTGGITVASSTTTDLHNPRALWLGLIGAGLIVTASLLITATTQGWDAALLDLGQFKTRDDLSAYGSHWRFHWLSTIWFGAVTGLAPMAIHRLVGGTVFQIHPIWQRIAWGYVLVLTLVFGLSAEVFTDVRYVGHQAREILTHGLITLPLGIGLIAAWSHRNTMQKPGGDGGLVLWLQAALVVVVPTFLATVALRGDVMAAGQSEHGLAAMIAAHNFEHTLDFVCIALLLLAGVGAYLHAPHKRHA